MGLAVERKAALRWEGEEGISRAHARRAYAEVNRCANAFRELGVQRRSRRVVHAHVPAELVSFFATIKIGASILPLFSGYGAEAAAARVRDAEATILVTADGFWRRGQAVAMKATADLVAEGLRHS